MNGKELRRVRRAKGLTQWQVAKALNLRPAVVLLAERGALENPELLRRITEYLEAGQHGDSDLPTPKRRGNLHPR